MERETERSGTERAAVAPTRGGPSLGTVSFLFFLSGATGLAYEAIWFKRFGQVWGSSALSLASVVACFLAGIGLGAWLGGRIADRSRRPLLLYAVAEGAIGILALVIPWELAWLGELAAGFYPAIEGNAWAGLGLRLTTTLVVLLPPTALMGATLPILVRLFTGAGLDLGKATSRLYGWNSVGAAVGVWATGFHLLPFLGIVWTNALAAGLNLVVCAWALYASRSLGVLREEAPRLAPGGARAPGGALVAAFASGLGSLILQMVWARQLVLLLGGSTYAYSALLAVFIAGLGGGSFLFRWFAPKDEVRLLAWISCAAWLLVLGTALGLYVSPSLARWIGEMRVERTASIGNALICVWASVALQVLPTLVMGFLFPAVVALAGKSFASPSRTVGGVYAWNTLGSILGAFGTVPFLFPLVGSRGAATLALACYFAVPFALAKLVPGRPLRTLATGALGLSVVALWGGLWRPDPRGTNLGLYLYGPERYPLPADEPGVKQPEILFFREGTTSNVLVMQEWPGPATTIRVNGKVDGGTGPDMTTQLGIAWIPRILRPEAKEILVIGFGTGTTAGASLLFPDTQVECVEIEPAVPAASEHFHEVNYAPEASPRFRLVHGDGRAHVQGSQKTYDIIVSEPSNPWIAGVANLYTREFFLTVRSRLAPNGLLAQWIQTYGLSANEFALVTRTLRSVFRHCAVYRIETGDTLFVASVAPVIPTAEELESAQSLVDAAPLVQDGLTRYFGTKDAAAVLLGHLLLDAQGVQRLMRESPGSDINTDHNLRLEFDAPRYVFHSDWLRTTDFAERIRFPVDIALYQRLIREWGYRPALLDGLRRWMGFYEKVDEAEMVTLFAEYGNALAPDDPHFLAERLYQRPPAAPGEFRREAKRLARLSVERAIDLTVRLEEDGRLVQAGTLVEELRQAHPADPRVDGLGNR